MGKKNHRAGSHKQRLVGENKNNSSRRVDDEPDEGGSETNAGIWSAVVRLKKFARLQISHSSIKYKSDEQALRTRTCGSFTMVHQPISRLRCVITSKGCRSPMVKVSDHGRHVMSSSPVPLKTHRVGQRCMLNLSRAQMSSRWWSVVVRRGLPAQVLSTSLDHGSKLLGPSPTQSPRVTEQCDVNIHSLAHA
ncbi:uncharacterized protein TNCV_3896081 [Trichonephila clavipes]|nr:uncharacterized protein TNCV_3896081 [Trichonephila clavipes]